MLIKGRIDFIKIIKTNIINKFESRLEVLKTRFEYYLSI